MTLIGAFKCMGGVILFADRQETISDYAKWDVGKIKHLELTDTYRLLMAGAGDSDMIDMIWSKLHSEWRKDLHGNRKTEDREKLKDLICQIVAKTTKKCILPYPAKERPWVELIWALQNTNPQFMVTLPPLYSGRTDLFRTSGLKLLSIGDFFATGNPIFLMRYLEDLFISGTLIGLEEAEALAAYLLWEAKEYDPTCGKHSDVFVLRDDASIGRMTRNEERYWEEHFEHLKQSLKLIPLLSCASENTKLLYNPQDHLARFVTTMKTLWREKEKQKQKQSPFRSKLEATLMRNLRKTAQKYLPKP